MAFLKNSNHPNAGMIMAFPTCIYQSQYTEYVKYNPILLNRIYKMREQDTVSNNLSKIHYGVGWTSYHATDGNYTSDYNLDNLEIFKPLSEFIWNSVLEYVKFVGYSVNNLQTIRLGVVWANINSKYSYHEQHTHPNSYLSGVYYLKVPKNSGKINFIDPRNAMRSIELAPDQERTLTDPLVRNIEVDAQEGYLLLFPSWLGHEVQQNLSHDDRVSIAFNIIPDYVKIADRINNK